MNASIFALSLFGVAVVAVLAVWTRWTVKQVVRAMNWPTTDATIQSADIEKVGGGRNAPEPTCFAFSYFVVGGGYFTGRFARSATDDLADNWLKK